LQDWSPFKSSAQWLVAARMSAQSSEPTLIVGEAGSGKSTLAAALHRNGGDGALQRIDCAALDDWAVCEHILNEPSTGTVLLERVLDLSPLFQARLVAWLDAERPAPRPRLLATACAADESDLRTRPIRQDLVDRLSVNLVRVPPLRERAEEITDIAFDLAHELMRERDYVGQPISNEAVAALQTYAWPGNVRQLRNVLQRALSLRPRGQIDLAVLPPELVLSASEPRRGLIEQLEVEAILHTLQSTGGNVSRAAQVMGLSRATLYRRLHAYRAQHRTNAGSTLT
jgi:DNA-binding NtrC family response regulator